MEKDELLKRVLMMQRLQGMETEPISAEDPYASMEKDQLISMIHFLVKREDERAQDNQELKDMVKELRDTHKQDVKTQTNLLKSIDNLTSQVADLTTQNKTLQQKVNDLLSQISVGNKVRFGSKSQKGIKKNVAPAQDREKDKDDFDGTNGAAISSTSQADTTSADAAPEPAGQMRSKGFNLKGECYTMHPDSKIGFDGYMIPSYATCRQLVLSLAPRLYNVSRLVSWDLAISEDGEPVLIEANMTYGGCNIPQMANGPLYGDLTGDVIKEVFASKLNRLYAWLI